MNRIARLDAAARAEIFSETAARKGIAEAIVEKDFWVCWALMQLFTIEAFTGRLLFKGGTSLSKIFGAINRFSEDIDLAVDYEALGFTGKRDPRQTGISKTQRNGILEQMMVSCREYIAGEFLNVFRQRCDEVLGPSGPWSADIDPHDPNVVRFRYPPAVTATLDYVPQQVVLELGTHAEFVPRDNFAIRSFVAEEFPDLIAEAQIGLVALVAKRTFWEKATILHAEFHRPPEKPYCPATHGIITTLRCWQRVRSELRLSPISTSSPKW